VILPGVGHMLTYTAPDTLVREVEALSASLAR